MTWQPLAIIQTSTDWLLTESVSGSLFRISHNVNGTNIQSLRSVIAQAFDEGANNTYFDFRRLSFKPEAEAILFIQPGGLLNRKLAIKRLDNLADSWAITIEVLDGMPESISLPISQAEVTGLTEALASKELAGAGAAASASAIAAHKAEENPHSIYATDSDVNTIAAALTAKEQAGAAANAIANHEAAADPHQQYATDVQIGQLQTAIDSKVANTDSRLINSRTPTGTAGGVLAGTYPNPSFKASVFAASLELNGWRKLFSGDIEQWGVARLTSSNGVDFSTPAAILFPLIFPNNIFNIQGMVISGDFDVRVLGLIRPIPSSNGNCSFVARNNLGAAGTYFDIYYRVIGS